MHSALDTIDDAWSRPRPPAGAAEVVVLGASNVTINLNLIVATLQATFPEGVRIFVAHGHGRSYGLKSRVLIRQLEGHIDSLLWTAWNNHGNPHARRYALITDVGNDLLYGMRVDDILGWVGQCASRLKSSGCELAIATLPTASLLSLSSWRYHATSRIFFPNHAVPWAAMQDNIRELDDGLRVIARGTGATIVDPQPDWYGFDPIHIRRRKRPEAMRALLGSWPSAPQAQMARGSYSDSLRLWTSRPARKWVSGRLIQTPQPVWSTYRHELWMF